MTSKEEPRAKYSYTFVLQAREPADDGSEEAAREEVQEYINELLGIKNKENRQDLSAYV